MGEVRWEGEGRSDGVGEGGRREERIKGKEGEGEEGEEGGEGRNTNNHMKGRWLYYHVTIFTMNFPKALSVFSKFCCV